MWWGVATLTYQKTSFIQKEYQNFGDSCWFHTQHKIIRTATYVVIYYHYADDGDGSLAYIQSYPNIWIHHTVLNRLQNIYSLEYDDDDDDDDDLEDISYLISTNLWIIGLSTIIKRIMVS